MAREAQPAAADRRRRRVRPTPRSRAFRCSAPSSTSDVASSPRARRTSRSRASRASRAWRSSRSTKSGGRPATHRGQLDAKFTASEYTTTYTHNNRPIHTPTAVPITLAGLGITACNACLLAHLLAHVHNREIAITWVHFGPASAWLGPACVANSASCGGAAPLPFWQLGRSLATNGHTGS